MSAAILVTDSTEAARKVRIAGDDDLTVLRPEQLPATAPQLLALVADPEAVRSVILDVRSGAAPQGPALDIAARLAEQYPSVAVMLMTDAPESLALAAMRSGVRDLIDPSQSVEDLRWSLRRAVENKRHALVADGETFSGRVISVASPKGGVGKTTVATNLAVGLAHQAPQSTVLVDLDIQFGDVAAALDLEPTYTLGDIVVGPGLSDPMTLKTLLTRHKSGLQVVCGVHSPAEADVITPGSVEALLQLLKKEFRFVIVDTAPGMSEQTMMAIDHTTDLVLVTSLDVPGVRGLRKELELLSELELQPATRHVVINFADTDGGLTVKDVEAAIGRPVDFVIPRSSRVPRTTNQGSPIIDANPRDKVSRTLASLVGRFAHISAATGRTGRRKGRTR
ncbi:AAA family ATPase [Ornithinimicrobium cerasi]|uniref:Pilus assembly protein CpaE n=1 Tax=Ornithinimicrobium cerasi TaxID=2248773 RepID=A0A285VCW0_9MICO|nr:AAA family ATPase [Ornithinimicrobium cerasi]SOC51914.1 pilus assembly protein CpaE [Ornithinimicrobium cerasi]